MKPQPRLAFTRARKEKVDDVADDKVALEDASAGKPIVWLLAIVALAVVLLIANRALFPPPEAAVNASVERDEDSLGIKAEYPVELLKDNNGSAASTMADGASSSEDDQMTAKEQVAAEAEAAVPVSSSTTTTTTDRIPELGDFLFHDADKYAAAPLVVVPDIANGEPFKGMWNLLPQHEKYFRQRAHKRYVPRLAQSISRQEFHQVFRTTSTPVIIPFEYLRKLGFLTRAQTMDELRQRYPYSPPPESSKSGKTTYSTQSGRKGTLDIGPAVFAISKDAKLEKIAVGVRNYPRNLQLSSRNLYAMDVSRPPFIDKKRFQAASMWFGTSSSDTKFHHDCCDNFVMMVAGTKRWFLAPPTDWRSLMPIKCEGDHQSLCWASVPYPLRDLNPREKLIIDQLNSITIDLKAGEMLYLPAGWWHFIQNLGPTVMLNHWTYGCENCGMALELDPARPDRPDFSRCESSALVESQWRAKMDSKQQQQTIA
jgi:hypothetical protein